MATEMLAKPERKENDCIDLLKLWGSMMIFVMHLGVFNRMWEYLAQWAGFFQSEKGVVPICKKNRASVSFVVYL